MHSLVESHLDECFKFTPKESNLYKTKAFKKSVEHLSKLIGIHGNPFGQDGESPTTHDFVVIKTKVQAVSVQDLPEDYFVSFDDIAESIMETTKNFRNFSKTDLDRQQEDIKEGIRLFVNGDKSFKSELLTKITSLKDRLKDSKSNVSTLEQKSVDKILIAIEKSKVELNERLNSFTKTKETGALLEQKYFNLVGLIENMTGEDIPVAEKIEKVKSKFFTDVTAYEAKSAASISDRMDMLNKVAAIVNALKDSFEDRVREDMEDSLIELQIYEKVLNK